MRRAKKRGIEAQWVKSPTPTQAIDALIGDEKQTERTKEAEERRKKGSGQRAKHSTRTLAIDALIGEEERNGKQKKGQKKEQKKETGRGSSTQLPWTIWSPLTARMDHTVCLF